jgi:uncharacterized protein YwqG
MYTILFFAALAAAFFFIVLLLDKFVWEPKRQREAEAAPRITRDEVQSFWAAIEESALPIAKANVQSRSPNAPFESRIGGAPLAIGEDTSWPLSTDDGFPMAFVAQVNFSEVPPMDGFPTRGVLQIFSSFAMIDDVEGCKRIIRWEPVPKTDKVLAIPEDVRKTSRRTSEFSEKMRWVGLPLIFEPDEAPGNP